MFNKPKNVLKTGDFIGNPLIFPPDKAGDEVSYVISESGKISIAVIEGQKIGNNFSLYKVEVLSRINLILLEITYANPVPVNLDELISSEYIRELCLEKFLEIMHFSDKSAEDVLSSSFSNSPIYRVTDRGNEKIMFANKGGNTSSREREEKGLSGELIPQHI